MFVQGDHGYPLRFIVNKNGPVDLTDAVVELALEFNNNIFVKHATITDREKCECEVILTSDDLAYHGIYKYQWTVFYPDGKFFSGEHQQLYVSEKLYMGEPVGETVTFISPFATKEDLNNLIKQSTINGNIIVNDNEITVFDNEMVINLQNEIEAARGQEENLGSVLSNFNAELAQTETKIDDIVTINIKDFGAIGDGVFDNKTVFSNITTHIINSNFKDVVILFPKGNYRTTASLNIIGVDNIKIIGNAAKVLLEGSDFPSLPYDFNIFVFHDVKRLEFTGLETEISIVDKTLRKTGNIRSYHLWLDTSANGTPLEEANIYHNKFVDSMGYPNTSTKSYNGTVWISSGELSQSDNTVYWQKNINVYNNIFQNSNSRVLYVGAAENVSIYGNKFLNQGDIGVSTFSSGGNTLSLRLMGVKNGFIHDNIFESVDKIHTGSTGVDYLTFIQLGASGSASGVHSRNVLIHDNLFKVYTAKTTVINGELCHDVKFSNNDIYFRESGAPLDRRVFDTTRGTDYLIENVRIVSNFIDGYSSIAITGGSSESKNVRIEDNIFNKQDWSPSFGTSIPISLLGSTPESSIFVGINAIHENGSFKHFFKGINKFALVKELSTTTTEAPSLKLDAVNKHTIVLNTGGTVEGIINGAEGQELIISNGTTQQITLVHRSANVATKEQFSFSDSANRVLTSYQNVKLTKMRDTDRWQVV